MRQSYFSQNASVSPRHNGGTLFVEEVRGTTLEDGGVEAMLLQNDVGEETSERAADDEDMAWAEVDAVDLLLSSHDSKESKGSRTRASTTERLRYRFE